MEINKSSFKTVEDKPNFSKNEEKILEYWAQIDAFKGQLKLTENNPKYTFYDGPPFATGLPHHGHITAGTIKDVVTRYWSQNGKYVERRFGWDCHGLPVEVEINKMLNIKTKDDFIKYGVKNYNDKCRSIVMKYSHEWKRYVTRFGRWIDFENDYKTMDLNFMESVWWVFKQIFDKGLVYRKCKIMPYSPACTTVLSNFEAGSNYKILDDPSIFIAFPLIEQPEVRIVAWTTTPWTLPSNLALAVNPNFEYQHIKTDKDQLIISTPRLTETLKQLKITKFEVVKKFKGSELHGKEYKPLFDDFANLREKGCFRVYSAEFVTSEDGTGIVHVAPAFGDDDYKVALKYQFIDPESPLCPIDESGYFTNRFPLVNKLHFKEADKIIIETLKKNGRLLSSGTIKHNYPCCYRTDTPLMYRAIPSWFIKVESFKNDIVENNKKASWVPKNIQEKRFHNWLNDAKDWCISRNRSWGNPIPLWVSDDFEEVVCLGSIEELKQYTGITDVKDLHREFIDGLVIKSKQGKGDLKRIEEVFDCWFESGSMPYAQIHYPFEISEEEFWKRFPADFIAEGLDQTRGWFYTLNVISTALFNREPYKNLIVNGIVLNDKGEKMSKSKLNYTDPLIIFDTYGADAMRLYLINSGLVKAQPLKFADKGVNDVIRDVFIPLHNSYRFLIQNIQRYESKNEVLFQFDFKFIKEHFSELNIMEKWIVAYSQRLIKYIRTEMENYRLYTVVSELLIFLDKLTNWFIRLNRGRLKGDFGENDCLVSIKVLYSVLLNLVILLSPIVPFITEEIYQNLKKGLSKDSVFNKDSIHYLRIPECDNSLIDENIEKVMNNMISVIELGRKLRENKKINLKMPIETLQIINYNKSFLESLKGVEIYIIDELNVNTIEYIDKEDDFLILSVKANFEELYTKSKEIKDIMKEENREKDPILIKEEESAKTEANKVIDIIKKLKPEEIRKIIFDSKLTVNNIVILPEFILMNKKFKDELEKDTNYGVLANNILGIRISLKVNEEMMYAFFSREIINRIQRLRKSTQIQITDDIKVFYSVKAECKRTLHVCQNLNNEIIKIIKVPFAAEYGIPEGYALHAKEDFELGDESIENVTIFIYKKK